MGMDIFFGTVVRSAPVKQGGELIKLNWESKKIESVVPISPTNPSLDHDPNPRGNSRGCRGIEVLGDRVIATTYHTIKVFDRELQHKQDISDGLMVGLHETYHNGDDKIWVSSTAIDAAIEYDLASGKRLNEFWPREIASFQEKLNLTPLEIDKGNDQRTNYLSSKHIKHPSHLHLNAISQWQGNILALFHAFGAIANLSTGEIMIEDPALKKGHNLLILEDGMAISNDTYGRTIRFFDLSSRKLAQVIDITEFKWVKSLENSIERKNKLTKALNKLKLSQSAIARPLFVRGLDCIGELLFVGISPASILCINWKTKELIDAYCYSKDVNTCVHGLKVLTA